MKQIERRRLVAVWSPFHLLTIVVILHSFGIITCLLKATLMKSKHLVCNYELK